MSDQNRIENLMTSAMGKLKNIIEVDTIVGNPIKIDGEKTLVPIAKVSMGFVAGGGEYAAEEKEIKITENFPFAGGSGAGVCVSPIGFICYSKNNIEYIKVDDKSAFEKIVSEIPDLLSNLIEKGKQKENDKNN